MAFAQTSLYENSADKKTLCKRYRIDPDFAHNFSFTGKLVVVETKIL